MKEVPHKRKICKSSSVYKSCAYIYHIYGRGGDASHILCVLSTLSQRVIHIIIELRPLVGARVYVGTRVIVYVRSLSSRPLRRARQCSAHIAESLVFTIFHVHAPAPVCCWLIDASYNRSTKL